MNTASPAAKKLQHARFYLEQIRVENQKAVGKDLFAIEAHVSSCFGHIKAAFYRLRTELGPAQFKAKQAAWRATLSQDEAQFFNEMLAHRDLDVHTDDIPLDVATSAIAAHLVPGSRSSQGHRRSPRSPHRTTRDTALWPQRLSMCPNTNWMARMCSWSAHTFSR